MLILVTYDISDDRRLRRVAKISEGYGRRVQKSVFECRLNEAQVVKLKEKLATVMDLEIDSVRFYRLCNRCQGTIEVFGTGPIYDDEEMILV